MLALPPVALRVSSIVMSSAPERTPGTRTRDGGKAPASKLFLAVDRTSKRGRVLAFFLPGGVHVSRAMAELNMKRPAILMTFVFLRQHHGIGYAAHGGTIEVQLPKGVTEAGLWL